MAKKTLDTPAFRRAMDLIAAGLVDDTSAWSPGGDVLYLARDDDGAPAYPCGRDGKVYRSALIAIRSLAAQQGDDEIRAAAGRLLDLADAERGDGGGREVRMCTIGGLCVETRDDGESPVLTGYAAVFDEETVIGGWFREVIRKGAFARAIREKQDVRALWNHNPDFVLGRTRAGTLDLDEDDRGLKVTIHPPEATWARDLVESIRRGDVSQMSFAFAVREEKHVRPEDDENLPLRELIDVDLFDVSPVTYPAYEATSIAARSPAHVVRRWLAMDADEGQVTPPAGAPDGSEQELEQIRMRLELERHRHGTTI